MRKRKIFIITIVIVIFIFGLLYLSKNSTFATTSNYGQDKVLGDGVKNIFLSYFGNDSEKDYYLEYGYKGVIDYYDIHGNKYDFMDTILFAPNSSYETNIFGRDNDNNITSETWNNYMYDQYMALKELNKAAVSSNKTINVILTIVNPVNDNGYESYDYNNDGENEEYNDIIEEMINKQLYYWKYYSKEYLKLNLIGFYWYNEAVYSKEAETAIKTFTSIVNDKEYKSIWIPFIHNGIIGSSCCSTYQDSYAKGYEYGFDFVSLQSGYYFRASDADATNWNNIMKIRNKSDSKVNTMWNRLEFAQYQANKYNMGIEFEADNYIWAVKEKYDLLYDFMYYGTNTTNWNDSYNIYYFPGLEYISGHREDLNLIKWQLYDDIYKYSQGEKVTKTIEYDDAIKNTRTLTLSKGTGIDKIYYKVNGASSYSYTTNDSISLDVTYGTTYSYYGEASTGYTINSCTKSKSCGGTMGTSAVSGTLSATANIYSISYSLNKGMEVTDAPTSAEYDEIITIPNPKKIVTISGNANGTGADVGEATSKEQYFKGWTFDGDNYEAMYGDSKNSVTKYWYDRNTMVRSQYFKNLTSTSGATITMTANWSPTSLTLPTVIKDGYTCKWYTNENGTGTSYTSGSSYTPTNNSETSIILYAQCIVNSPDDYIELDNTLVVNDNIITNVKVGNKIDYVYNRINTSGTISIFDRSNNIITDRNNIVKTGDRFKIELSNEVKEYILSIKGDVSGDGKVNVTDITEIIKAIINNKKLDKEYFLSADIDNNSNINVTDIVKIVKYITGNGDI